MKKAMLVGPVLVATLFVIFLLADVCPSSAQEPFVEDFENGIGSWYADNGVWQVGTPSAGPSTCFGGSTQCAGTVLDGFYGCRTASRLISPSLSLPGVSGDDEIHLRFYSWHEYHYSTSAFYDFGQVQVSKWDANSSTWNDWVNEGIEIKNSSSIWSLKDVDLTAYAGEKVRIAFLHTDKREASDDCVNELADGWFIDDIQIVGPTAIYALTFDTDNDGVPDGWDECFNTPLDTAVFSNGCPSPAIYTEEQCQVIVDEAVVDATANLVNPVDGTRISDGEKILFTQADLNQEILNITNGELYTEDQMNLMLTEILTWGDMDGDGQIGLQEAINALRVVSGVTAPAGTE